MRRRKRNRRSLHFATLRLGGPFKPFLGLSGLAAFVASARLRLQKKLAKTSKTPKKTHLYVVSEIKRGPSKSAKCQDDQLINFDHLDHLDETKDLAAKMIKRLTPATQLIPGSGQHFALRPSTPLPIALWRGSSGKKGHRTTGRDPPFHGVIRAREKPQIPCPG